MLMKRAELISFTGFMNVHLSVFCQSEPRLLFEYVKKAQITVHGIRAADQHLVSLHKLTRNKNARHIFPRHFLTVAMIGIKFYTCILYCISFIHVHYFSNTYTTSVRMTITAHTARARRAPQLRGFSMQKIVFEIACSSTEQKPCEKKDQLYHVKCQSQF